MHKNILSLAEVQQRSEQHTNTVYARKICPPSGLFVLYLTPMEAVHPAIMCVKIPEIAGTRRPCGARLKANRGVVFKSTSVGKLSASTYDQAGSLVTVSIRRGGGL